MKGFFDDIIVPKATRGQKSVHKKKVVEVPKNPSCHLCHLDKGCLSPKMKWTGEGRLKTLVIGEAGGRIEDKKGKQFVGDAGKLLREKLQDFDLRLDRDFWKDNALACRPPENRTPTNNEVAYCRPHVLDTIRDLKPKKIFLFGRTAIESVIGHRFPIDKLDRWLGQKIPDQRLNAWLYPMYHLAYLLRQKDNGALWTIFDQHFTLAIEHSEKFPDWGNEEKKIVVIPENVNAAIKALERAGKNHPAGVDFEMTGLKPHRQGHKVVTMAVSTHPERATAFPIFYDSPKFMHALKKFLSDPRIGKYAQNMKFEDMWSRFIFGYPIRGWRRDTMLGSHVLNNRHKSAGLKFNVYAKYGTTGYDDSVASYLEVRGKEAKDANAFNKIDECPLVPLLTYNGMDSMFTRRLAQDQIDGTPKRLREGYQILHDVTLAAVDIEGLGVAADTEYYERQALRLDRKKEKVAKQLNDSKEVKRWRKAYGGQFNHNSDPQLRTMLFDLLNHEPVKFTNEKKENYSVDKEVLASIGTPFVGKIRRLRQLDKLRNTYLAQFLRETTDGIIHPFFHFASTDTKSGGATSYRGSSSNPNLQNVPKHDEEAQKIIRRGIIPREGHQLLGVDYSRLEVCVSACCHKDPQMITYLQDLTTDMHRDQAMELFLLEEDEVTERLRFLAKNDFVFAQFYGDWYEHCARNLWRDINNNPVRDHLKKCGIKTYDQFEDHVRTVERIFWEEKFPVYAKWKEKIWARYQRIGHIDLLTGFRCIGLMKKNELLNRPIQGPAVHLMFWALAVLNRMAKERKWSSGIIGYIHDEMMWDLDPEEKKEVEPAIRQVMCGDIKKRFPWLNVPLNIEAKISEVDGNWSKMRKEPL